MSFDRTQNIWKTDPSDLALWEETTDQNGNQLMRVSGGFVLTSWRYIYGANDYEPFAVTYIPGSQFK